MGTELRGLASDASIRPHAPYMMQDCHHHSSSELSSTGPPRAREGGGFLLFFPGPLSSRREVELLPCFPWPAAFTQKQASAMHATPQAGRPIGQARASPGEDQASPLTNWRRRMSPSAAGGRRRRACFLPAPWRASEKGSSHRHGRASRLPPVNRTASRAFLLCARRHGSRSRQARTSLTSNSIAETQRAGAAPTTAAAPSR